MVSHKTSPFYNFPVQSKKDKKPVGSMDINATFADLPAPELKWEEMAEAPVVRLDGAAIQIKNLLYVFAGYGTINHVRNLLDTSYIVLYLDALCLNISTFLQSMTSGAWKSGAVMPLAPENFALYFGMFKKEVFANLDLNDSSN